MCGIFGQTELNFKALKESLKVAREALEAKKTKSQQLLLPNFNIWTGMSAWVLLNTEPQWLQPLQFGLTPSWAKKQMYLFNARTEGDANVQNSTDYAGVMGIFEKPSFREAILYRRCLIPMDYFIEGPEQLGLRKPFLIHKSDRSGFVVAGIWDKWVDARQQEVCSFSILTTAAAPLIQEIGHHRSPLVLAEEHYDQWLSPETSTKELVALMRPFDSSDFSLYPISEGVTKKRNSPEVMTPVLTLFD